MITTPNDPSVADVQAAWSGVDIPSPSKPAEAWPHTFLACILLILAWVIVSELDDGRSSAAFEGLLAFLAVVPVGFIVVGALADHRASVERAAAHSQELKRLQGEREHAVEALRRGYGFIGSHYLDWMHSGERLLRDSLLASLNLEADDTSTMAVEAFSGEIVPESIPAEPEFHSAGAAPYPLPKTISYTFYFVTSRMLIVSPSDTCRITSTTPGFLAGVKAMMDRAADSPVAVAIQATSLACAAEPDQPPKLILPESQSSQELYFQEFVNVRYATASENKRSEVVVTMRDGREIAVPGSQ